MTLDRALAAARADLGDIPSAALWCYNNGYPPLAPNPDLPSIMNAVTGPVDYVPGPRFDIGQGDYRCRTAWQAARTCLLHADLTTFTVCDTLRSSGQPPRSRIDMHNPQLDDIGSLVRALTWRIEFIDRFWPSLPWDLRSWVKDALAGQDSAVWQIGEARSHLTTHHHRPGDPTARTTTATVAMCRICRIQAAAPRKGGMCERCAKELQRSDRPRSTVIAEIRARASADVERAKRYRNQHGCGYGAE